MMKKLTIERAKELNKLGYTCIASVVKTHFNTSYHNVNSISSLLDNGGKWIPCPRGSNYKVGINSNHINWEVTCKTNML